MAISRDLLTSSNQFIRPKPHPKLKLNQPYVISGSAGLIQQTMWRFCLKWKIICLLLLAASLRTLWSTTNFELALIWGHGRVRTSMFESSRVVDVTVILVGLITRNKHFQSEPDVTLKWALFSMSLCMRWGCFMNSLDQIGTLMSILTWLMFHLELRATLTSMTLTWSRLKMFHTITSPLCIIGRVF